MLHHLAIYAVDQALYHIGDMVIDGSLGPVVECGGAEMY